MENGLSIADAMAMGNGNFGMNGNGIWVLFLLYLFGLSGNGFGGQNQSFTNNDLYTNLNTSAQRLNDNVYAQNASIKQDLCNGFAGINQNLCNLGYKQDLCCCETQKGIEALRYENAKNTCDIITATKDNTQLLLNALADNKIEDLRSQLLEEKTKVSQYEQSQYLVNTICPKPIPAYCVTSPCGCNA